MVQKQNDHDINPLALVIPWNHFAVPYVELHFVQVVELMM